jgi:hypothetical protein
MCEGCVRGLTDSGALLLQDSLSHSISGCATFQVLSQVGSFAIQAGAHRGVLQVAQLLRCCGRCPCR